MGFSILEAVVLLLRDEGFQADVAYPGQKYPVIRETSAAVHIEKVDRDRQAVTVEVTILCPAERGGTQCELEALRATEILRSYGAACVQNGCAYDGIAQVYCVEIQAEFICVSTMDSFRLGPGYQVYINDIPAYRVTSFTAERYADCALGYAMGEAAAVGSYGGSSGWKITIDEQIPPGEYEQGEGIEPATVTLEKDSGFREIFREVRWTSVKREYDNRGVHRIRMGIAPAMEEVFIA